MVRDTGIEPVTSSVSGKRATAAPIAPVRAIKLIRRGGDGIRTRVNGFAGRCLAARPRHRVWFDPRSVIPPERNPRTRADDETRTRDPNLGKVVRYQLRYIRMLPGFPGRLNDFSRRNAERKTGRGSRACPRFDSVRGRGIRYHRSSVPRGLRAIGAVGSALPSHGRGHRFESGIAHRRRPGITRNTRMPGLSSCPIRRLVCALCVTGPAGSSPRPSQPAPGRRHRRETGTGLQ